MTNYSSAAWGFFEFPVQITAPRLSCPWLRFGPHGYGHSRNGPQTPTVSTVFLPCTCRSYWAFEHSGLNFVLERVPGLTPVFLRSPARRGLRTFTTAERASKDFLGSSRGFRGHTPAAAQVRGGEGARRGARSGILVEWRAGEAGQALSSSERARPSSAACAHAKRAVWVAAAQGGRRRRSGAGAPARRAHARSYERESARASVRSPKAPSRTTSARLRLNGRAPQPGRRPVAPQASARRLPGCV